QRSSAQNRDKEFQSLPPKGLSCAKGQEASYRHNPSHERSFIHKRIFAQRKKKPVHWRCNFGEYLSMKRRHNHAQRLPFLHALPMFHRRNEKAGGFSIQIMHVVIGGNGRAMGESRKLGLLRQNTKGLPCMKK